ncbi:hypothetical protein X798_03903 [Onchocerca flexuosa]|uniref:Bap31/Bap29 cytoplasmic coiled-coil domain-containing protein n=1 Tax=Onchocerca flexuosa TaxID=387005 RepID=A0A238BW75_9BILA|nr:hypothetical protein X798_03903 [Onchocerca flexuosa]
MCADKNDASVVRCGIDFISGNSGCTFVTLTLDSSIIMEQILQKSHGENVRKTCKCLFYFCSLHPITSLCRVIKRLAALLSRGALLEAAAEAAMKQAESASKTAKSYMVRTAVYGDNEREKELERQVEELGKGFIVTDHSSRYAISFNPISNNNFDHYIPFYLNHFEELKSAQVDKDAMKEQSEGLQREYDRVCGLLEQAEKASGDKKED